MTERLLDQKTLRRAFELLAKSLRRRGVGGDRGVDRPLGSRVDRCVN